MENKPNKTIELTNFERGGYVPDWQSKPFETPTIRSQEFFNDVRAYSMSSVDPFINIGSLQPGLLLSNTAWVNASAITTAITAMDIGILSGTITAYGIGDGKVYQITNPAGFFNTVTNAGGFPRTITNEQTGFTNDIIATYLNITSGMSTVKSLYILYSYNLSTTPGAGRVGWYDVVNDSFSDTKYTLTTGTVPNSANTLFCDRPMIKGTNGKIYIGSGYQIDSLDTNVLDATMRTNVLDIPQDYRIKSLGWYRGNLVITAQKNISTNSMVGQVAVFFWDTLDPDTFTEEYYINDAVTAGATVIDTKNELYIFTSNVNFGHLRHFNGQFFEPVTEIPSTIPQHGAVDSFLDGFIWGSGSSVYRWASVRLNSTAGRTLWQTNSTNSTISCVKRLTPQNYIFHVATSNSGSPTMVNIDTSKYVDSAQYDFLSISLPNRSTLTKFRTYFPTLSAGCDTLIKYVSNYGTSYANYGTISFAATTQTSPAVPPNGDGPVARKLFTTKVNDISELRLALTWSFANATNQTKIKRIEIESEFPLSKDNY